VKYKVNYGSGVVVLPEQAVSGTALDDADLIDLKVLICAVTGEDDIPRRLGCRPDKVDASLRYWQTMGILGEAEAPEAPQAAGQIREESRQAKLPTDEIPSYNGDEMEKKLAEGGRKFLLDECQQLVGKIFNVTEVNKVIAMSDYLGLENEHILMLFAYCCSRDKKSVAYIEKTAYNLYNEGIDTTEKLELYLKEKEDSETVEKKLRGMLGWGARALTPSEKSYIRHWVAELGYRFDIIERSYQQSVDTGGEIKHILPYMNKILESWHNDGYRTLKEINEAIERERQERAEQKIAAAAANTSFETDEFVQAALRRSYASAE